jgi:hypothetical protein
MAPGSSIFIRSTIRDGLKETIDPELAREAAAVENEKQISAQDSRARFREAIESRYTAPARFRTPCNVGLFRRAKNIQ